MDMRFRCEIKGKYQGCCSGHAVYLLGIPIKDFTVIASGDNKTGVIAQDLMEKYPELVYKDNDGNYMVDGINAWKLVEAIQEQQGQIEELQERSGGAEKGLII